MIDRAALQAALEANLALGREILDLIQREHLALTDPAPKPGSAFQFFQQRLRLIPRLEQALSTLRAHRTAWSRLTPQQRQTAPEIAALLRANQELLLRILTLDRENQQLRLRHGLLTAGTQLRLQSDAPERHRFSALA